MAGPALSVCQAPGASPGPVLPPGPGALGHSCTRRGSWPHSPAARVPGERLLTEMLLSQLAGLVTVSGGPACVLSRQPESHGTVLGAQRALLSPKW